MASSVSLQGNTTNLGNPYIADVGKTNTEAVVIASGFTSNSATGTVQYQIRRQDQSNWVMDGTSVLNVYASNSTSQLVRAVSASSLTIVLPFRQWFEVRTRNGSGDWSSWLAFKTKDKTYKTPDAITEMRVATATNATGQTVTVTNVGKATVTNTAGGATVNNSNLQGNDVYENVATATGQRIRTRTVQTVTSTGVRIEIQ